MTRQKNRGKARRSWKIAGWIALTLMIAVGLLWLYTYPERPDQMVVLEVNEEEISVSEAMIYHRLMQRQFEMMGSENIWDLNILGLDPEQTEMERVLESIIRVKTIQPVAGMADEVEEKEIIAKANALEEFLGQDYIQKHEINRELIEKVVRENYLAYRYEKKATFLPGSNEEDIKEKMNDIFSRYDHLNVELYTRAVTLRPMMFYTGEWVEGEWVTYSEAQKAVILEMVQRIYENLEWSNFKDYAEGFADCITIEDNPVFSEGVVQNPKMNYGTVYFGQMKQEVAEQVWSTESGAISKLIETEYGYLIVEVISYLPGRENEVQVYEERLEKVKEEYRSRIIEELKDQRMEEEWQRLEQESKVLRYEEVWENYAGGEW